MWFKSKPKKLTNLGAPIDPNWARNENSKFFRFINLNPENHELAGKPGIFIIWHGGTKPTWVFVGTSRDLARDLDWCRDNEDIMYFERFGGLFASWAFVRKEYQDGAARYLTQIAKPLVDNPVAPGAGADPIPVLLPGTKVEEGPRP